MEKRLNCMNKKAFSVLEKPLRSELSTTKRSQLQARSSHTEFRFAHSSGFSLAEVTVVLIILMGIILLVGRIAIGDRQKEYDAKINKLSSVISANITKDLVENTGAEYADYASVSLLGEKDGNEIFQEAVKNNLNQKPCNAKDCWGAKSVGDKFTNDDKDK